MSLTRPCWVEARSTLVSLLSDGNPTLKDNAELRARAFVPQSAAKMHLPAKIGTFSKYILDLIKPEPSHSKLSGINRLTTHNRTAKLNLKCFWIFSVIFFSMVNIQFSSIYNLVKIKSKASNSLALC